jgi:hypothetical protein
VLSRRQFLAVGAASTATLAWQRALQAESVLRDPYAPLPRAHGPDDVVRVRGRVTAGGRGVAGVAVSDGRSVTKTERDGRYTLVARRSQSHLFICPPSSAALPAVDQLARAYRPLGAGTEQQHDFSLTPLRAPTDRHAFLLFADPQMQDRTETERFHAETVPDAIETVRGLGGVDAFGVGCGDLLYDDLTLAGEWDRGAQRIGVPFVQVVGNHDLDLARARTDDESIASFRARYGPSYWSFDRGEIHYVVLDDVFWHGSGYIGYVPDTQLEWLAADLAMVEMGRTVVVLTHIPALSTRSHRNREPFANWESINNREALYRLLEGHRAHILSGHTHEQEHLREGGVMHHVHGAVCGAWWSGPICWDGTPNGYSVYEARGSELRWRYKGTGLSATSQARLYRAGSDPSAPDQYVANVWDWQPGWTVRYFEDGTPRGVMSQRPGRDPLSVALHTGADKPTRRPWVEPMATAHLFMAPATPGTRELRVEMTNQWGEQFVERLTLS